MQRRGAKRWCSLECSASSTPVSTRSKTDHVTRCALIRTFPQTRAIDENISASCCFLTIEIRRSRYHGEMESSGVLQRKTSRQLSGSYCMKCVQTFMRMRNISTPQLPLPELPDGSPSHRQRTAWRCIHRTCDLASFTSPEASHEGADRKWRREIVQRPWPVDLALENRRMGKSWHFISAALLLEFLSGRTW